MMLRPGTWHTQQVLRDLFRTENTVAIGISGRFSLDFAALSRAHLASFESDDVLSLAGVRCADANNLAVALSRPQARNASSFDSFNRVSVRECLSGAGFD